MDQKKFNKNITCTQMEDIAENTIQQKGSSNKFLSYKFEIMEDESIYSISFEGKLTQEETKKIMETVQNCLYEKIADGIHICLKQHNIAHSGFVSSKMPLEHSKIMELAELLLHSDFCSDFDAYFGNADICYLIADHQKWTAENYCQGCYFAVKRTLSESENLYKYNIIGQAFSYNETSGDENCYFAIRHSRDSGVLYNITASASEPVLPTFGSINIMKLLANIDNIQTAGLAEKAAVQ